MSDVCKIYLGNLDGRVVVLDGPHTRPLTHIAYHSPTGFAWGYAGSGPADLALAILADYFEEPEELVQGALRSMWAPRSKAVRLYQAFKDQFVATSRRQLRIESLEIEAWLALERNATALQLLNVEDRELAQIRSLDATADAENDPTPLDVEEVDRPATLDQGPTAAGHGAGW